VSDERVARGEPAGRDGAAIPTVLVAAAVVERDGRFLITRRLDGTHLAGCWEFPGGKCEAGEEPASCLAREMREELDVDVVVGEEIFRTRHSYADRVVELRFLRSVLNGVPRPLLGQEVRWAGPEELRALSFPPADSELIELLTRHG
jgi:8-oxo-dGTP diphosphatase